MSQLTKELRNDIYTRALYKYKLGITDGATLRHYKGICYFLWIVCRETDFILPVCINSQFPEFYKHKPIDITGHTYWWPLEDHATRIKVLEQAIKDTE